MNSQGDRATIRLLLADDQALVRGALAALLDLESDLSVVAEVGRGDEVVSAVLEHRPDVALLDVEMPGMDGIAATAALREAAPDTRVLIVTTFGRPGFLRKALARRGRRVRRQGHPRQAACRRGQACPRRTARRRSHPCGRQPRQRRVAPDGA